MGDEWIFESVVGYLLSPVWQVPISTFIEERCVVFDPEEDNPKAYKQLFIDYKHMVDFLLESFLEDLGLEADSFIKACQVSRKNLSEHVINAFEEVEASRDYEIFKRMMIQKNIELELQALRMIQQRNGVIPDAMAPNAPQPEAKAYSTAEEERILMEVLEKSKEDFEKGPVTGVNKDIEKALANSKEESTRLQREQQKEKEMLDKALKLSLETQSSGTAAAKDKEGGNQLPDLPKKSSKDEKVKKSKLKGKGDSGPPPLRPKASVASVSEEALEVQKKKPPQSKPPKQVEMSNADAATQWMQSAKEETQEGSKGTTQKVAMRDDAELRKREEYLKQQRDKLLAMKKQARQKSLDTYTSTSKEARNRPISARAAKQAASGKMKVQAESSEEDKKKMAMRMALADRLKKEVINKKE